MPIPAWAETIIEGMLGDQDAKAIAKYLPAFWARRADKDDIWPDLRLQYVALDGADMLLAQVRAQVQTETPQTKVHNEQKIENLQTIRKNFQTEIDKLEGFARASRPAAVGTLTNITPRIPGPYCAPVQTPFPDPNSPGFRGDPEVRTLLPDAPMFE